MSEDRKITLLKAAFNLIGRCPAAQSTLVYYDDAECDGMCLMDDIRAEIAEEGED